MKCPCEYGICSECQQEWHDSLEDRIGWHTNTEKEKASFQSQQIQNP